MIILDTHIWIWWIQGDSRLTPAYRNYIQANEPLGLGVSVISCWEIAKLIEIGKLTLPLPVEDWINRALAHPGIRQLDLTPRIAVEATQLPGAFHRDPSDQLIVATARVYGCPLVTMDSKIRQYPHVQTAP
ncbi:MAG: type II toxin-antitoxin system VapC family toxin [Acidobacteria bacterium]|nr:type II toxin-antitoxin system VapC family toxin [Acidobacteriota bacterium]